MKVQAVSTRRHFANLLWYLGRPWLYRLWVCKERWPKRFSGLWNMVHQPEWQKNTAQSALLWLATTVAIFQIAHRTGHGFWVSVSVSLVVEAIGFTANKLWIWRKRQVGVPKSGVRNFVLWGATFGLNCFLAWLIIPRIGLEDARAVMVVYGVGANPVLFKARDKLVFAEANIKEAAAAWIRKERAVAEVMPRFMRY